MELIRIHPDDLQAMDQAGGLRGSSAGSRPAGHRSVAFLNPGAVAGGNDDARFMRRDVRGGHLVRHAQEPITLLVGVSPGGVGAEVARRLAREGHHLILATRRQREMASLQDELEGVARSVRVLKVDATRERHINHAVDDVLIQYGRVDNLVYTPGRAIVGPFLETPLVAVNTQLEDNLVAPWLWMQALVRVMRQHSGGRLIFLSAAAGRRGHAGMSGFSAAKHALSGLVEAVAREHRGEGIQPVALVLNGVLDQPANRERMPNKEDWGDTISMAGVCDAVVYLMNQDERAMTHELWLTPGREAW